MSFDVTYCRSYAEKDALKDPGPLQLRPWMLNFNPQLGLRGEIEPATSHEREYNSAKSVSYITIIGMIGFIFTL